MDTRELEVSLKGTLGSLISYLGIFASNEIGTVILPLSRDKPIGFISNTLESSSDIDSVGHWVCFYVEKSPRDFIIFFVSYDINPEYYSQGFSRFLSDNFKFTVYKTKRQIQQDLSLKCGLYVLFFIHSVSHNKFHGLKNIHSKMKEVFYSYHIKRNDRCVTGYYFKYLKKLKCSDWRSGDKKSYNLQGVFKDTRRV